MRRIAFAAAAVLFVQPALAADSVTSTIASVDTKSRTLVLTDRTIMSVGETIDLAAVKPGMKVVVATRIDEDGYAPASSVTPVN